MTNHTTTYTEQQIDDWGMIFGASAGIWSWWHAIHHITGDWDTPGSVRLIADDPDDEDRTVTVECTADVIFAALNKATETYPWLFGRHPQYGDLDLDASSADLVLQVALFGEAVYG